MQQMFFQCAPVTQKGIFFITRQKDNAVYTIVAESILTKNTPDAVLKEEIIQQTYTDENKKAY
ncbi:MAG: hypothetical protein ABI325_07055 [Ginsengibacter sp.]